MNTGANGIACRVCHSQSEALWTGTLLKRHAVRYFECTSCGYIQTESPYWLEEAYADVINASDTGIMSRNLGNARIVFATLLALGQMKASVLDYAGGYGILVRLLRDIGIDALWSDRYCRNLLARGFEFSESSQGKAITLVTAFEALEHFVSPTEELETMFSISPNVLLSTKLLPLNAPAFEDWWYYGAEHGQHIGFFRFQTLEFIAKKFSKVLISDGDSYHLFVEGRCSDVKWRFLKKSRLFLPLLIWASARLGSRTWSDHLLQAGKTK